jgi:excisionase family DNA binding protein
MQTTKRISQAPEPSVEPLLTAEELAAWLVVPVSTLYRWRYVNKGPCSIRVGRGLRYRREDVERWLERLARETGP